MMDEQRASLPAKSEDIARCWYVYYKLDVAEAQILLPHIADLLTALQQKYAVLARLHQRLEITQPNTVAGYTWMETYQEGAETLSRLQGESFADVLRQAIDQTPTLANFAARRHIECFMEVPLCA